MPFAGPYAVGSQEFINAIAGHNRGGPHVRDVDLDPWTGGLRGIYTDPRGPVSGATNQSPLGGTQSGTSPITGSGPVSGGVNLGTPESVTAKTIAATPGITPSLESVGDGASTGANGAIGGEGIGGIGGGGIGGLSAEGIASNEGVVSGIAPSTAAGNAAVNAVTMGLSSGIAAQANASPTVSFGGQVGNIAGTIAGMFSGLPGLGIAGSALGAAAAQSAINSSAQANPQGVAQGISNSLSMSGLTGVNVAGLGAVRGGGGSDDEGLTEGGIAGIAAPGAEVGPAPGESSAPAEGGISGVAAPGAEAGPAPGESAGGPGSSGAPGSTGGDTGEGQGEGAAPGDAGGGVGAGDAGGVGDGPGSAGEGFRTGGWVPGRGGPDSVPARLTPGEFVVQDDVAARYPWLMELLQTTEGSTEHPWADSPYADLSADDEDEPVQSSGRRR